MRPPKGEPFWGLQTRVHNLSIKEIIQHKKGSSRSSKIIGQELGRLTGQIAGGEVSLLLRNLLPAGAASGGKAQDGKIGTQIFDYFCQNGRNLLPQIRSLLSGRQMEGLQENIGC